MSVIAIHAKMEEHVVITSIIINVTVLLDTLELTVKQVMPIIVCIYQFYVCNILFYIRGECNCKQIIILITRSWFFAIKVCYSLRYFLKFWWYSRTPLLRPPLGLAIGGRNRGVAVIQALEHVATCVYVANTHVHCIILRDKTKWNLNYSLLAYTIVVYWHTHAKQLGFKQKWFDWCLCGVYKLSKFISLHNPAQPTGRCFEIW